MSDVKRVITMEEAYPLILQYSEYFYRSGKFYSIAAREDLADIQQDIIVHFLEKRFLEKFNPEVTSVKYFIMTGVKHFFIDMLRKQKNVVSLDEPDEDGLTLADKVASDIDVEETVLNDIDLDSLLEEFSDETDSKIIVVGPLEGSRATQRTVARYLIQGYSQKEITKFFLNPKSRKPVSSASVSRIVAEIKDIMHLCGYC